MLCVPLQLASLAGTDSATEKQVFHGGNACSTLQQPPRADLCDADDSAALRRAEEGRSGLLADVPPGSALRGQKDEAGVPIPEAVLVETVAVPRGNTVLAPAAPAPVRRAKVVPADGATRKRAIDELEREYPAEKRTRAERLVPAASLTTGEDGKAEHGRDVDTTDGDDDGFAGIDVQTPDDFDTMFTKVHGLGEGSYGVVYAAVETAAKRIVAVKRTKPAQGEYGLPISALREYVAMRRCQHENILSLTHAVFIERRKVISKAHPAELALCFEMADMDLRARLERDCAAGALPPQSLVRSWLGQLLAGVEYMHSLGMAHRDLKPDNLLLFGNTLKIADLGMARPCDDGHGRYTHEVVTQWYRSPELLLGTALRIDEDDKLSSLGYDPFAVDMWSVGTIFAEMCTTAPLFCGRNELDQLCRVLRVTGVPDEQSWTGLSHLPNYGWVDTFIRVTPEEKVHASSDLAAVFTEFRRRVPRLSYQGFHMLAGLLVLNPEGRCTAAEARRHAFFAGQQPLAENLEHGTLYCSTGSGTAVGIQGTENKPCRARTALPELVPGAGLSKLARPGGRAGPPIPLKGAKSASPVVLASGFDYLEGVVREEFNPTMRLMVMDWMIGVADRLQFSSETLHMAAAYFDMFMNECARGPYEMHDGKGLPRREAQAAATACLWLAMKLNEVVQVDPATLVHFTKGACSFGALCRMESHILLVIGDKLPNFTAHRFLQDVLDHGAADRGAEELARCIMDCSLLEPSHNTRSPTLLAAGCAALAQEVMENFLGGDEAETKHETTERALGVLTEVHKFPGTRAALLEIISHLEDACAMALGDRHLDFLPARWGPFNCGALAQHVGVTMRFLKPSKEENGPQ